MEYSNFSSIQKSEYETKIIQSTQEKYQKLRQKILVHFWRSQSKWSTPSRWSFRPNSAWGSIETTTIGNKHSTVSNFENHQVSTDQGSTRQWRFIKIRYIQNSRASIFSAESETPIFWRYLRHTFFSIKFTFFYCLNFSWQNKGKQLKWNTCQTLQKQFICKKFIC